MESALDEVEETGISMKWREWIQSVCARARYVLESQDQYTTRLDPQRILNTTGRTITEIMKSTSLPLKAQLRRLEELATCFKCRPSTLGNKDTKMETAISAMAKPHRLVSDLHRKGDAKAKWIDAEVAVYMTQKINLETCLQDLIKELQDEAFNLNHEGQHQYRDFLTELLLWTDYESKLLHTLLKDSMSHTLSRAILPFIMKKLKDPSRLSIIQQRMIDANCLRRAKFIKAQRDLTMQRGKGRDQELDEDIIPEDRVVFTSTYMSMYTPSSRSRTISMSYRNYPLVPKQDLQTKLTLCSLCSHNLLPSTVTSVKRWRKHVLQDVLPYTCIFEKCASPFEFHPSAVDWLAHMEKAHSARQWICYGCSPSDPRVFHSLKDYTDHFHTTRQHAGITTEEQIHSLAQLNETPQPLKFNSCPLCRWSEGDVFDYMGPTLQEHIAEHLFSFAMRSIPSNVKPDNDSEDGSFASNRPENGDSEGFYNSDSSIDWRSESDGGRSERSIPDQINPLGASTDESKEGGNTFKESHEVRAEKSFVMVGGLDSSMNDAQIESVPMCNYCKVIADFFRNLNIEVSEKTFKYHSTREEIYMSVRSRGCQLCKVFLTTAFGDNNEADYQELTSGNNRWDAERFGIEFLEKDGGRYLELLQNGAGCFGIPLCSFEIVIPRDGALSNRNWTGFRPLFTDASSGETISFLRGQLKLCLDTHPDCRSENTAIPTRLLYVKNTIKVARSNMTKGKPPEYIFLSACWGSDFALRLNHSNQKRLQEEIKITELPKTIRDAIIVARALNIDYVFVDSLCILQDSMEDWHREVERMESYIKGCTLTLGAGSSPSLAAGFLDIRSDQNCFDFTVQAAGSLPDTKIFLRPRLPSDWDSLSNDPLFTRLWTLQELSLCPRSILFGSSRIVWNCRTHMTSDAHIYQHPSIWAERLRFDVLLGEKGVATASPFQKTHQTDKIDGSAKLLRTDQEIYEAWHTIIETASQLKVTFERDRLPALSAFISIVRRKLNDDELINGLWRGNLHRDLLWHRVDTPWRVTADESIPSWSWAACSGRLSYSLNDFPSLVDYSMLQDALNAMDTTICTISNIDERLGKSRINMYAPVVSRRRVTDADDKSEYHAVWEEILDWTKSSHMIRRLGRINSSISDFSDESENPHDLRTQELSVIAISSIVGPSGESIMCLVVEEVETFTYRRRGLGLFHCQKNHSLLETGFFHQDLTLV